MVAICFYGLRASWLDLLPNTSDQEGNFQLANWCFTSFILVIPLMWPVLSKPSYQHVLTESKQHTNIYWSLDGTSLVWRFQSKGNIDQNCPLSGGGGRRLFLEVYEKIPIFLIIVRLRVIREQATGGSTVATSNWPIQNRKYHGYSKALF